MALKGRKKKSLFSRKKNLQSGQKSSKMVRGIKIAHFDPGSDGIRPGVCLSQIFWENQDLWYIWVYFSKMVIYIWGGGLILGEEVQSLVQFKRAQVKAQRAQGDLKKKDTISAYSKAQVYLCIYVCIN